MSASPRGSRKPPSEIELEIIRWLAEGKTASEIAAIRGRAHSTVREQVTSVRRKLEAMNSAHIVAIALRKGLIM